MGKHPESKEQEYEIQMKTIDVETGEKTEKKPQFLRFKIENGQIVDAKAITRI